LDIMYVLELSIDDFVKLYELPPVARLPVVRGQWDHVIYGEVAFGGRG